MINPILEGEYQKIAAALGENISQFRDKKFLITGADGLIASYLTDFLLWLNEMYQMNIYVYAMSLRLSDLGARFQPNPNLCFIEQNLNEPLTQHYVADYVIHAASNAHPLAFSRNPVGTMKTNLIGTMNLLEMLKETTSKFVYISTGEVYGNNVDHDFTEDDLGLIDSKIARSCYPESKRAAETLCMCYNQQFNIPVNVLRLCYIYGASITNENSRADAQFLRNALDGVDIVMKSEGAQRRTYCYVADMVNALLCVLVKGDDAQVYNVANPHSIASVREYAETLAEVSGVAVRFELPDEVERKGYSKQLNSILDSSKLQSLGWEPLYDLKAGLSHTFTIKKEQLHA